MTNNQLPITNITIGTRQSTLALWQTHYVAQALEETGADVVCEIKHFVTKGDQTQLAGIPLPEIGGKGLFTWELENALRRDEIQLAVHSLKDLPVEDAEGLLIGAVPPRASVQDVLVAQNGWILDTLPMGAVVGTGSKRRAAQLLAARPDLEIRSIRGNVETRMRKVLEEKLYDATILAAAGLERLALTENITQYLPLDMMLPAPGQGALAVQCSVDNELVQQLLDEIHDVDTYTAVTAERRFLSGFSGGCSAPVAAYAEVNDGEIFLRGLVASADGQQMIRVSDYGRDPQELGQRLAQEALANGAAEIMQKL
ncbi:MAG: hydroxymethylbilane synthase [Anaerolineales bacterium]|nr:hydroxymethylbilane synthase [Anaerolineales bacterium]